jgi:hypothetical protein
MKHNHRDIWITLNNSIRSKSLAKLFSANPVVFNIERPFFIRHTVAPFWVVFQLIKYRPKTIYSQYSFSLQVILAIYKLLVPGVTLTTDFHNKALQRSLKAPVAKDILSVIKRISIGHSNFNIISNSAIPFPYRIRENNLYYLPDPLPEVVAPEKEQGDYVIMITSFADDEPIDLYLDVIRKNPDINFVMTGHCPAEIKKTASGMPNLSLPGFLPRSDYIKLLGNSLCAVCMTTSSDTLQCGIYETIVLSVDAIANNSEVNKSCFGDSIHYSDLSADSLSMSLAELPGIKNRLMRSRDAFIQQHSERVSFCIDDIRLRILQAGEI